MVQHESIAYTDSKLRSLFKKHQKLSSLLRREEEGYVMYSLEFTYGGKQNALNFMLSPSISVHGKKCEGGDSELCCPGIANFIFEQNSSNVELNKTVDIAYAYFEQMLLGKLYVCKYVLFGFSKSYLLPKDSNEYVFYPSGLMLRFGKLQSRERVEIL